MTPPKEAPGPLHADALAFAPPLLRIQQAPPAPLAGWMLRGLVALLACLLLWAAVGKLDIVAVAEGKLVPASYLKIVQPCSVMLEQMEASH